MAADSKRSHGHYVKLADDFYDHTKYLAVGPVAGYLAVCALAWCGKARTDGYIPAAKVRQLIDVDGLPRSKKYTPAYLAARLVEVGIWDEEDDGYRIHDYLTWQESAEEIAARSNRNVEAGRLGGLKRAANQRAKQLASDALSETPSANPSGTQPDEDEDVEGEGTSASVEADDAGVSPLRVSGVKRGDVEIARRLFAVFNELAGHAFDERKGKGGVHSLLGRIARLVDAHHGELTVEQWEQGMRRHAADPPDVIRRKGGVKDPGDFFGDTHHLRVMELGQAAGTGPSGSVPVSQEDRDADAGRDAVRRRLAVAREQAAARGDDLSEPTPGEAAVLPADWRRAS